MCKESIDVNSDKNINSKNCKFQKSWQLQYSGKRIIEKKWLSAW